MVFMEDSERAAARTREHGIEAGLHLNFTMPFSESPPMWTFSFHYHRWNLRAAYGGSLLWRGIPSLSWKPIRVTQENIGILRDEKSSVR
jgi:hypothetical protein